MSKDRIAELKEQIKELKQRWPAHSVPPAMMAQLDTLEEELTRELQKKSEAETFQFQAIGYVENEFPVPIKPDTLSASPSRIVLAPDLLAGLTGLEPGMPLLVVFVFHRADGYDLLQHPRGDRSRPKRGVFALHSPNRPNPIGVTEVELVAIEGNILTVHGLDALDGTPVLDLKPV
ncbi:MAG: SAM-dependent methyltransferase [Anaerolineales bacterium]|nr:SAM-dependent methyltransferase [Anaerolineales bacterium]